jgi:hypothetical protein
MKLCVKLWTDVPLHFEEMLSGCKPSGRNRRRMSCSQQVRECAIGMADYGIEKCGLYGK